MSLRMPSATTFESAGLRPAVQLDLDWLAGYIRDANQPVAIDELARQAVRSLVVSDGHLRTYTAGRSYRKGERIRLLNGSLGDVASVDGAHNSVQGSFDVLTLRMHGGGLLRVAAGVHGAPDAASPELVTEETVDLLLAGQRDDMVRIVRRALSSDPRFITLYYSGGEYGCLREFFPPMSPDVLDAALAVLLDALFDQVPLTRISDALPIQALAARKAAEPLFADDRLDGELTLNPDWLDPARGVFDTVRSLWSHADRTAGQDGADWSASQLSSAFLQPLLRSLGWSSVPLPTQSEIDGLMAMCVDDVAASELYIQYEDGEPMEPWVVAMAQSAAWGRSLDAVQVGTPAPDIGGPDPAGDELADPTGDRVPPAHQMVGELRRTGVRWGVLTNGRVWRLFSRDANSLSRAYYEVDLSEVFDGLAAGETPGEDRWAIFRRWWLLFRKASYLPGKDGRCLLESLREDQPEVSRQVHDLLRDRILNAALPAVAGGFVAYRHHRLGITAETPESLSQVLRASVQLLSRLVFVLIAEARDHLPLCDPEYRPHALTTQAQWASERMRRDLPFDDGFYTTPRYDVVLALLYRVSKGDSEKHLPCYGRLFFDPSEDRHAFLERTRLNDAAVARALDSLFRSINYAELDARDYVQIMSVVLGSRLTVQDAAAGKVAVARGGSSTRSTALPGYVVKPAVDQALGPALEARGQAFADAMEDVIRLRKRLRRALDRRKRSALYGEWEEAARGARDALLGIHVCDPAMGAGEFLLGAVDVLTDGIIERIQAYHHQHPKVPRAWNPVLRLIDDLRQDIVDEMGRQRLDIDAADLTDATLLSRLVAQRALFGVADDPLAAEVAVAALWLHTFTQGAPFSFLDHHLRLGQGLVGTDLSGAAARTRIEGLDDQLLEAVDTLYALMERVDATPLDVRWSAAQFSKVQSSLEPFRRLLDLAVRADLGDTDAAAVLRTLSTDDWQQRLERYADSDPASLGGVVTDLGAPALHWPLAFPEVFIDLAASAWREDAGFDLVIGTPPWTDPDDNGLSVYLRSRFGGAAADYDVHHAYLALARLLVRPSGGRTSYVLSRQWLARPTGGI